jgi:4-amino-4-deoxy-L-arabinose transferase-like glycosyltransferase
MPRRCSVCNHAARMAIDLDLTGGDSMLVLAKRYGLDLASVQRHKQKHLSASVKSGLVRRKDKAVESWLAARRWQVILAIVCVSLLLRAVYFVQLDGGPCIWQHRWAGSDMNFFDSWAKQIAGIDPLTGKPQPPDLLSERVLMPLHGWHIEVAAQYSGVPPERYPAFHQAALDPSTPEYRQTRAIWDRWCGHKQFYQDPLYTYLVALTYKVLGPDVRWVFAWQMLLGVAGNVLIYLIARKYFGEWVAVLAAALAVLCSPMLYYELILVRETLISLAGLLMAYLTTLAFERRRWGWWVGLGAAVGLSIILKSHFVLFLIGVAAAIVIGYRKDWRRMLASGGLFMAGVVVAISPLAARNVAVGVSPLTTTSAAGITFIGANTVDYAGNGFFVSPQYAARIMGDTNGKMLPAVIECLKTHPDIASYAQLVWGKFEKTWQWYEIPSNSSFDYYRLHSSLLRHLPVTFLLISPLALVGLVLAVRRFKTCWPLYLLVLTNLAVLLMFHVMSRHRRPLLAALIPFAAIPAVWIAQWIAQRKWVRAVVTVAALILVGLWTSRPLPAGAELIRPVDYEVANELFYVPLAEDAAKRGDWKRATEILAEALRYEPPFCTGITRGSLPVDDYQILIASRYGHLRSLYAQTLQRAGMESLAAEQQARGQEMMDAAEAAERR